jgi:hypothetical protein
LRAGTIIQQGSARCGGLALQGRLAHQRDVAHGEVAQAAVDELGGAVRGPGGEVLGLDERHGQAPQRGVPGDAGAGDAAPDDEQVEGLAGERAQEGVAVAGVEGIGGHRGSCSGRGAV